VQKVIDINVNTRDETLRGGVKRAILLSGGM